MKAQNKEEKLAKQQEREKLQREIAAREKAERIQSEYEDRLKKMQADMELRQKALLDAQSTIKLLEDQLKETQVRLLPDLPVQNQYQHEIWPGIMRLIVKIYSLQFHRLQKKN